MTAQASSARLRPPLPVRGVLASARVRHAVRVPGGPARLVLPGMTGVLAGAWMTGVGPARMLRMRRRV
jgi:hypothetical protein